METLPQIPNPELDARRSRRGLMVALLFVLFRALPNISYPLGRDQATYCVIGQGLLNGQQLYRDLWDIKPPGIFALYALLVKAFGHVMWSAGLVDILWLLIFSYCLFRFAERYLGTAAAVITVVIYAAWHANLGYVDAGQPECFLLVAVFLAFFIVSSTPKRWLMARQFAAGLLMGAAFWLKYNALFFFPLVAVIPYVDWGHFDSNPKQFRLLIPWRSWRQRAGGLLAGFFTTLVAVFAYIRWAGSWAAFREGQFQVLPRYGAIVVERIPHYWGKPLGATLVHLGFSTLLATLVAAVMAERQGLSRFLPILAAAVMGYAVTASQLRFPPYAFETSFPFFAMIWGYLATTVYVGLRAAARSPSRRSRLGAKVAAGGLVAVLLWYPLRGEAKIVAQRYRDLAAWSRNPERFYANYPGRQFSIEHFPGKFMVIKTLRESLTPGEEVFVWGTDPLIYFLTNRQPPTRFVPNHPLISPWGPPAWRQELVRDLRKSPPAFIVVSQNDQIPEVTFTSLDSEQYLSVYTDLGDFISASYRQVGEFPDFVLYQLKTAPKVP